MENSEKVEVETGNGCDDENSERNEDGGDDMEQYEGDYENTDCVDPAFTDSVASAPADDLPASTCRIESVKYEEEFSFSAVQSFLLDESSKDLLSVVRQCYQSSKLLKHHEQIYETQQVFTDSFASIRASNPHFFGSFGRGLDIDGRRSLPSVNSSGRLQRPRPWTWSCGFKLLN